MYLEVCLEVYLLKGDSEWFVLGGGASQQCRGGFGVYERMRRVLPRRCLVSAAGLWFLACTAAWYIGCRIVEAAKSVARGQELCAGKM